MEERASRAVNDWVCQDPGENLGIFHQVQVINAMLGSICGIANEMLLLGFPLHQTAVAGAFTDQDAIRNGNGTKELSGPTHSQSDNAPFGSGTGPDFPFFHPLQNFLGPMFFDQQRAAGIRHGKQRTVDGSLRKHSLNPLTALDQTEQNTGPRLTESSKKNRRKTFTASKARANFYS